MSARRLPLLDFLLFHEVFPFDGWKQDEDLHRQFFDAVKDWCNWTSALMPAPIFPNHGHRYKTEIVNYKFFFEEEDGLNVHILTEEGEYFALNELEILVDSDVANMVKDRKASYFVPLSLRLI